MAPDTFSRRRALTYIAVALIIGVTAPFTAYAATGGLVNITDPVYSSNKARVNSHGQLLTTVSGQVATAPAGTPWTQACAQFAASCSVPLPAGRTIHLTNVSFWMDSTPSVGVGEVSVTANGATLSGQIGQSIWFPAFNNGTGPNVGSAAWSDNSPTDVYIVVPTTGVSTLLIHRIQWSSGEQTQATFTGYVQ
jgi:hypothetical protein